MGASEYWGEPISRYTRAQALADGVLCDVTAVAREAGFRIPVALTAAAWAACVAVPGGTTGQDEVGRAWDVLVVLRQAIRAADDGPEVRFGVRVRRGDEKGTSLVKMKAVCGPGDAGEPVVTVMLPDED